MSVVLVPLLIPFIGAIVAFMTRKSGVDRWVSITAAVAHLIASIVLVFQVNEHGIVSVQLGDWPAPFGITMVADGLSAAMTLITGITGLAIAMYSVSDVPYRETRVGFHALLQMLLAGVTGAFLTGDLFNLYVWFEVMLIASFGLLILNKRSSTLRGALPYVGLNLISTIFFLTAVGMLYGLTGSLNMAHLHVSVSQLESSMTLSWITLLLMLAFGIKSAVFPLFFWLPSAYHTPSFSVSAIFAGLLTKVGVYALIRVFTTIIPLDAFFSELLLWCAMLTMFVGVIGAAAQQEVRRILSFHIISQIGYMVLGLALNSRLALVGAMFYLIHHIIVKANLFLIGGVIHRLAGSGHLKKIGGFYAHQPVLAILFLIPAFSLAGFPPLSGFWAKYVLIQASMELEEWLAAGTALLVGLLTIYSMTKIWGEAFWKPHPTRDDELVGAQVNWLSWIAIAGLAVLTVIIGLFPAPFYAFAEMSALQLLNPEQYVNAVLKGGVQ